tara:strand:- start:558 stop:1163 length:606 start_codon:yes stop_codon:yes gene_type:complete
MGAGTKSSDYSSLVIGQYNLSGSIANNEISFDIANTAFVIGNGKGEGNIDGPNPSDAFKVMFNGDATAVIHFAAHKAVGESVIKPLKYYKNNLYSLLNTLSSQIENGIQNFIFSSSATVYGKPKILPITEENETQRPFSAYGNTKKIAEEILEDLINSSDSFAAISLRYFNPIRAHDSGLIGFTLLVAVISYLATRYTSDP